MKLRAQSAAMLAILMLFFATLPASGSSLLTSTEREQIYSAAVQSLEAYIESYGQGAVSLTGIEETFASLGRYEQSPSLMSYTRILAKLEADEYDYDLLLRLEMLDKDAKFKAYLNDVLKGSAIGSVEELTLYAAGREYEYNQQPELAIDEYAKCMSFFDANKRYGALKSGQDKAAYEEAAALWDNGDFAGAYFAFGRTSCYQDSEQRRASIISLLGYTPGNSKDNPEAVGKVTADVKFNSITLKWNPAKHASGYKVCLREKGAKDWGKAEETKNRQQEYKGLTPETAYEYQVIAVCGQIEVKPASTGELKTKKKPTPTPTRTPTPSPTPTPTLTPTPVPLSFSSIMAEPSADSIHLTWHISAKVSVYRVYWRKKGTSNWMEQVAKYETATLIGLDSDTEYEYYIGAEYENKETTTSIREVRTQSAAKPLKVSRIVYNGMVSDYPIEIQYSGGVQPIRVTAYHYFNSNHNAGITKCIEVEGYSEGDKLYLHSLVPTQRYWIKLMDSQNTVVWYDYTVPDASDPDVMRKLWEYCDIPDLKVKVDRGDIFFYQYEDHKKRNMNTYTSERIRDRLPSILIRVKTQAFEGSSLAEIFYFGALVLPNGDVYTCGGDSEFVNHGGGEKFIYLTVHWYDILDTYGDIPKGNYTFMFGIHDNILIKKLFSVE